MDAIEPAYSRIALHPSASLRRSEDARGGLRRDSRARVCPAWPDVKLGGVPIHSYAGTGAKKCGNGYLVGSGLRIGSLPAAKLRPSPVDFIEALAKGRDLAADGLCGRLLKGKSASDFETLSDDPKRSLVLMLGADGLERLKGKSGYEMLVEIGYEPDYIRREIQTKEKHFEIVICRADETAVRATWSNVIRFVGERYPSIREKLERNAEALASTPFAEIQRRAGFNFAEVEAVGPSDPRYMTIDRLEKSPGTLEDARAFLYFTLHLKELFSGDGFTRTNDGRRGVAEYLAPNRTLDSLPDHAIAKLEVDLPS